MINIEDCTEKCYAKVFGQCTVLKDMYTDCDGCRFYKPEGCEDWVKVKASDGVYLYTPEEYEKRRQDYGRE